MDDGQRFWARVAKGRPDECWSRPGTVFQFSDGITRGKARAAWWLEHGPIQPGMVVRHVCDNNGCVNTAHMELGSQSDNMAECWAKGRQPRRVYKKWDRL
jgi:hypothetical protein